VRRKNSMKEQLLFISFACLPWLVAEAEPPADQGETPAPLSLVVELTDGSRLIGTSELDKLPFIAKYGKMKLVIREVASVTLGKDRETGKVTMKNGDNLQGVLDIGDLKLRTLMGEISVPIRHVSRIAVTKGVIRKGLVLYYSFDEKGKTARDLSGRGNHGKIHGAKWTPKGKVGGAYEFDGKTTYIQRDFDERSEVFPTNTPFSVAAWFRTSATTPSEQTVLGAHLPGRHDGYFLKFNTRDFGGRIFWEAASVHWQGAARSRLPVNDGRWHHTVGTWDGKRGHLYLDGSLEASHEAAGPIPYPNRPALRIGHLHRGHDVYYFNGTIDEVMVFNRALSAADVKALFEWNPGQQ